MGLGLPSSMGAQVSLSRVYLHPTAELVPPLQQHPQSSHVVSTCTAETSRRTRADGTRPPAAPAQASKSLRKAGPTSATMSEVVVARPYFWKACWLHCRVRAQAPKAATSSGLGLRGEVSGAATAPCASCLPSRDPRW